MGLKDIVTDAGTGMVSHTKIWANIAYAVATGIVIHMTLNGQMTGDVLMIYLGIVGASSLGSKLLSLKYGEKPNAG